ncbi:MAG: DNA polymerase III subunit delta [Gammaproteobacteria bacterium TMED78]|nr:MAG: DNA polymerase III subunit delta [Gammaproteobacteria bacterium TMED78]|tara:strand:+ start:47050 stop:48054 length:1005 start_codon:yes stop_codon:yes gene_type:complete
MRLNLEKLNQSLDKGLSQVYLVGGSEHLLTINAIDQIRSLANKNGFLERDVYTVIPRFDWAVIEADLNNLSLFSSKKIIEIRINSESIGRSGSKAIKNLLEKLNEDILLLVSSDKIDLKLSWVKDIDLLGTIIQIWPVAIKDLPNWLKSYAKKLNLILTDEASQLLAERVEGNLLAADQELKKIFLLGENNIIDEEAVIQSVSNNSKYNIFALSEAILLGNRKRTFSILENLKLEGMQPVQILWILTSDIIKIIRLKISMIKGKPSDSIFFRLGVMKRNIPLFRLALSRYSFKDLKNLLHRAYHVDKVVKGASRGHSWCEITQLILSTFNKDLY